MVSINMCNRSNTLHLHDSSSKIVDVNVKIFNMIAGINDVKMLVKHISYEWNVSLMIKNVIQSKNRMITVDERVKISEVLHVQRRLNL